MAISNLISDAKTRMNTSVETVRREFSAMRTGRASLSMLDNVRVDYYGTPTPLNQVGNLSIPDAALIQVEADRATVGAQQPQIVTGAAAAVDDAEIATPGAQVVDDWRHELAKSLKPEVSRFGTTRQLERVAHRAVVGLRLGVSSPVPYKRR